MVGQFIEDRRFVGCAFSIGNSPPHHKAAPLDASPACPPILNPKRTGPIGTSGWGDTATPLFICGGELSRFENTCHTPMSRIQASPAPIAKSCIRLLRHRLLLCPPVSPSGVRHTLYRQFGGVLAKAELGVKESLASAC